MFKKLVLAFALLLATTALYADIDLSALSSENQQLFINQALSVQTEQSTETYGSTYSSPYFWGSVGSIWAGSSTSTDWVPYMGPNRISKYDFLRLTGQYDLAEEYLKSQKSVSTMHTVGYVMLGTGLAGMIGTLIYGLVKDNSYNDAVFYVLTGVSSLAALSSIPLLCVEVDDNTSVSFAVNLATIYNQNLFDSLK